MAKYKYHLNGDFQKLYNYLKNEILNTSSSASLEEQEYLSYDNLKIGILVFERYSYTGGNRLSLNVTIVESNGEIDVMEEVKLFSLRSILLAKKLFWIN